MHRGKKKLMKKMTKHLIPLLKLVKKIPESCSVCTKDIPYNNQKMLAVSHKGA